MFYPIHFTFFFYKILNYLFKSLSNNMLCLRYPQFPYLFIITNIYSVRNVSRSFSLYSSPIKSLHPKFSIIFNQTLRHPPFSSIKNIPPWIFPPFQFQYFSIPPLIFLFRKDHRSKSPSFHSPIHLSSSLKYRMHGNVGCISTKIEPDQRENQLRKRRRKKKKKKKRRSYLTRPETSARDTSRSSWKSRSRSASTTNRVVDFRSKSNQGEGRGSTVRPREKKRKERRGEERKKDEREKGVCLYNWGEKVLGRVKRF